MKAYKCGMVRDMFSLLYMTTVTQLIVHDWSMKATEPGILELSRANVVPDAIEHAATHLSKIFLASIRRIS